MSRPFISADLVSCEYLFELKKYRELEIDLHLYEALKACVVPWAFLGAALTEFIESRIDSVPAEQRLKGRVSPQAFLDGADRIVLGAGACIEPGAYVQGPCWIEPMATIRHGAYVRGSVYISHHAVVGHTTECKGSVFLPHAKAAHFNYVGDSILGHDCNLGAGTKLANLKISRKEINLTLEGKKVFTGLKKFGAILGNRAQTGCNGVTNPGTILLPGSFFLANQTVGGIHHS